MAHHFRGRVSGMLRLRQGWRVKAPDSWHHIPWSHCQKSPSPRLTRIRLDTTLFLTLILDDIIIHLINSFDEFRYFPVSGLDNLFTISTVTPYLP
jgi:hypothetical protein